MGRAEAEWAERSTLLVDENEADEELEAVWAEAELVVKHKLVVKHWTHPLNDVAYVSPVGEGSLNQRERHSSVHVAS